MCGRVGARPGGQVEHRRQVHGDPVRHHGLRPPARPPAPPPRGSWWRHRGRPGQRSDQVGHPLDSAALLVGHDQRRQASLVHAPPAPPAGSRGSRVRSCRRGRFPRRPRPPRVPPPPRRSRRPATATSWAARRLRLHDEITERLLHDSAGARGHRGRASRLRIGRLRRGRRARVGASPRVRRRGDRDRARARGDEAGDAQERHHPPGVAEAVWGGHIGWCDVTPVIPSRKVYRLPEVTVTLPPRWARARQGCGPLPSARRP